MISYHIIWDWLLWKLVYLSSSWRLNYSTNANFRELNDQLCTETDTSSHTQILEPLCLSCFCLGIFSDGLLWQTSRGRLRSVESPVYFPASTNKKFVFEMNQKSLFTTTAWVYLKRFSIVLLIWFGSVFLENLPNSSCFVESCVSWLSASNRQAKAFTPVTQFTWITSQNESQIRKSKLKILS